MLLCLGWLVGRFCVFRGETAMKTSIFDMTFVLPPMVVMTEVEKNMPAASDPPPTGRCYHC